MSRCFVFRSILWYTPQYISPYNRGDTMTVDKTYENRVRRQVGRRGYRLEKSRRKDPKAWDYGTYQIVDVATSAIVGAYFDVGQGYGLSIEDVEEWLEGDTPKPGSWS